MNVDFHSHILPGVDDGAGDLKESLALLKLAQQTGTKIIITTPHYYPLRGFSIGFKEIKGKFEKLEKEAGREKIDIKVICGQEVAYSNEILVKYEDGDIGTINNSNYMLIEFPLFDFSPREILDTVYELQIKGIKPILAHPERYTLFMAKPELINLFIKEGYLFQLNSDSLVGEYGRSVKKLAELYVRHGIYSVFGSDAHDKTNRTTDMTYGIKVLCKTKNGYVEKMNENACSIIDNKSVVFDGELLRRKRMLFNIIRE